MRFKNGSHAFMHPHSAPAILRRHRVLGLQVSAGSGLRPRFARLHCLIEGPLGKRRTVRLSPRLWQGAWLLRPDYLLFVGALHVVKDLLLV